MKITLLLSTLATPSKRSFISNEHDLIFFSFKKTKSMTALLEERSKRQKANHENLGSEAVAKSTTRDRGRQNLQSLVESVKRKSTAGEGQALGKRRKL